MVEANKKIKVLPDPEIRDVIESYWLMDVPFLKNRSYQFFPRGYPFLEFYSGAKWEDMEKETRYRSTVIGLTTAPKTIKFQSAFKAVMVRLQPWALSALLGEGILENTIYDMEAVYGKEVALCEEELFASSNVQQVKLALDAFFKKILAKKVKIDARIKGAMRYQIMHKGVTPISDVANHVNISQRRLEQLFIAHTGISAKKFSNIIRFQYALYCADEEQGSIPAEGYYDQSHFIRQFKNFTGHSPKRVAKNYLVEDHKISNLYNFS